ncbi:hypothetical protein AB4Y90_06950 [Chryseobacterium sp. 2TAF14]|uniref:hypothetical protein n=1 Tax=Chryseobacterium sp. 2TAF14 TaxID=3233007 RepID=UPI003F919703
MKKLLAFFVIIINVKAFSQESVSSNKKDEKVNLIYDSPYPEGAYGFRHKFYEILDRDKVNEKGIIKSEATFIVTSEGKITNIKATGTSISMNNEMERAITEMNKFKWFPKKLNGKPIDSKYRLPVTITFAED